MVDYSEIDCPDCPHWLAVCASRSCRGTVLARYRSSQDALATALGELRELRKELKLCNESAQQMTDALANVLLAE